MSVRYNPTCCGNAAWEQLGHRHALPHRLRRRETPRPVAIGPRHRCMAASSHRADRVRQDGCGYARLGGSPSEESRGHAPPTGLVPADADARGADGDGGPGLVRQSRNRSGRPGPAPTAGGRARAHGRSGRGRLAGGAGVPSGPRRHSGHAAEPCADARLRLVPGDMADGICPPSCGRTVGVRRGTAYGHGPRDLDAARSVSRIGRGSNSARRPSSGKAIPQPLDLGHSRTAVACDRRSSRATRCSSRHGRSVHGAGRQAHTPGARRQEPHPFAGGAGFVAKRPTSPTTSAGWPTRSWMRIAAVG